MGIVLKKGSALFIGCSFTFGQNLYYDKWFEKLGKQELNFLNKRMSNKFGNEGHNSWPNHNFMLSSEDYEYLFKHRTSKLVCDKLNLHEILPPFRFVNGGDNFTNFINFYKWFEKYRGWIDCNDLILQDRKLKLVVFQLTYLSRTDPFFWTQKEEQANYIRETLDIEFISEKKFKNTKWESLVNYHTHKNLKRIKKMLNNIGCELLVWSGTSDFPMVENEDFFVDIEYEGKKYNSFEEINGVVGHCFSGQLPQVQSSGDFSEHQLLKIEDDHPNSSFNKLITDNILRKYNERN